MLDTVSSVFESTLKTKRLWIPTSVGMTDKKTLKVLRLIAYGVWLVAYSYVYYTQNQILQEETIQ